MEKLGKRLVSEGIGTAFLLISIVGSGIAADEFAPDNLAMALLVHALCIGGALIGLILAFGPISAHFNPAVSLYFALKKELPFRELPAFFAAQMSGAILGVLATHAMFDLPLLDLGSQARTGPGIWLSEFIATVGLLFVIIGGSRSSLQAVALGVGGYIMGGIWFFSSRAFANPAVTVARSLTDTFTAIRPIDVLPFCIAQVLAALLVASLPLFESTGD